LLLLASTALDPRAISVVIPARNEAQALERNLPAIVSAASEVVVSDGASSDATLKIAADCGARVIEGPPGRGSQLNRGARSAQGEGLLFLHADTQLPGSALESVASALGSGSPGGGFLIRFDSRQPVYRIGSTVVNLRSRWFRTPLGDQAQFASRSAFESVGGYPEWPLLEDLEFIRRLKRLGKLAILEPAVSTSPRRFEQGGIARTLLLNWLIFTLYYAGVSPPRLAKLYRDVR
jgi:rSAM/selenodomain-associated transferase 2